MSHSEHVERQEMKDYIQSEAIFKRIFRAYNAVTACRQTKQYSHYDMDMKVTKKGNIKRYNVEIKERNQDMDSYDELPLTMYKFLSIKESCKNGEIPLIIYLINDEEYYIFNLNDVCLCECEVRLWRIQAEQLSANSKKRVEEPTVFIPTRLARYNGQIHI